MLLFSFWCILGIGKAHFDFCGILLNFANFCQILWNSMISGNSMILASVGNMVKDKTKAGQSSPESSNRYCFLQIFNLFLDRCFSYVIIEKIDWFRPGSMVFIGLLHSQKSQKSSGKSNLALCGVLGPLGSKKIINSVETECSLFHFNSFWGSASLILIFAEFC